MAVKILMNKLCILLFFIALAAACKGPSKTTTLSEIPLSTVPTDLPEKERLSFTYIYHNANKEKILGNYETAANLYAQCIKIDNSNPAPFYELASIYEFLGKYNYALEFARQAAAIDPNNIWYQMLFAEVLQQNNQPEQAAKVYEKLIKQYPDNIEYDYELANTLLKAGKYGDAIKIYDKLESKMGVSEELSVQKQRLYLQLNQFEKAENEIQELIKAFPAESRYYAMLADMYQANNMPEKAVEIYHKILEFDTENPFANLSLADYYKKEGNKEKAFEYLKKAYQNPALDIDTKVKILLSFYAVTERDSTLKGEAYELCNIITQAHPQEAKAFAVHGDFLYRDNRFAEARDQYRKALELDKDKFAIWNQLLIIESQLGDFGAMEKESEQVMELFPTQPSGYLFNGMAKNGLKKYKEAAEILETGAGMVVDNPPLSGQFYATLGDVYNSLKDHEKSDAAYEKALTHDANNAYVLNNYSYYLSLRAENLEKAEALSKKSNEIEPNSASFQDTYGWILYKLGRYDEARTWLEKAIANGGKNNGVIQEHYGDVLFKLNNKEEALQSWKKAKEAGGGSELLEKKIEKQTLIE